MFLLFQFQIFFSLEMFQGKATLLKHIEVAHLGS